ncbi:hypothetical protein EVAR_67463_1 [Eumeta japonica]|uniref:Uncharacterized protein n=1 Tax=Eumeta variegata TaxID=151549 RepID=A0A4C1ZSI3_EUMVA|nr:hypothetical protein EVAR_67463_1 [Eumeta japonica]
MCEPNFLRERIQFLSVGRTIEAKDLKKKNYRKRALNSGIVGPAENRQGSNLSHNKVETMWPAGQVNKKDFFTLLLLGYHLSQPLECDLVTTRCWLVGNLQGDQPITDACLQHALTCSMQPIADPGICSSITNPHSTN